MKRYYCAIFDQKYLAQGLALIDSLSEQSEGDWHLFAVCVDSVTMGMMKRCALPNITLYSLREFEQSDSQLLRAKGNRTKVEYLWTTKPAIMLWLVEAHPEIEILTHLDADLWFFSSPEAIFEEMGGKSILIHEHRYTPELREMEFNGKYNSVLVAIRSDHTGLEALRWWRERCIESCELDLKTGKCGDQMHLSDWPERYSNVKVVEQIGLGVAPWNVDQYDVTRDNQRAMINGLPLVFYHFHSLAILGPGRYRNAYRFYIKGAAATLIYEPYTQALTRWLAELAEGESPFQPKFTQPTPVERRFDLLFTSRMARQAISIVRKSLRRLSTTSA